MGRKRKHARPNETGVEVTMGELTECHSPEELTEALQATGEEAKGGDATEEQKVSFSINAHEQALIKKIEELTKAQEAAEEEAKAWDAIGKQQKVSFSINAHAQALIKKYAEEYGVTQGRIVELAPIFFKAMAMKSLERRRRSLETLNVLYDQLKRTVAAMETIAPHVPDFVIAGIFADNGMYHEKDALKDGLLAGVFSDWGSPDDEPAYHMDVREIFKTCPEVAKADLWEYILRSR